MIPKLSTQQPWGYNVKPLQTMLRHVEARLHSYTWIDTSCIRVRAEGKHTSIWAKKNERFKNLHSTQMLCYPWSLAQKTLSTAFNNRSCLTPSSNAQSLPQAAAISELYQVNSSGPIPSRCAAPGPLRHRCDCRPNWGVSKCGFPSKPWRAPGGQQSPQEPRLFWCHPHS